MRSHDATRVVASAPPQRRRQRRHPLPAPSRASSTSSSTTRSAPAPSRTTTLSVHGVVSPVQFALATFCVLNAWICVCELALMIHCAGIRKRYDANTKALGAGRLPPVFYSRR